MEWMSFDEFRNFVGNLFPRLYRDDDGKLRVGEDRFQVVRMFTIGIFAELESEKFGSYLLD